MLLLPERNHSNKQASVTFVEYHMQSIIVVVITTNYRVTFVGAVTAVKS